MSIVHVFKTTGSVLLFTVGSRREVFIVGVLRVDQGAAIGWTNSLVGLVL